MSSISINIDYRDMCIIKSDGTHSNIRLVIRDNIIYIMVDDVQKFFYIGDLENIVVDLTN